MAEKFPGSDFARLPPHNLDAERSALGGVLVKPVMFDELATTLGTDDFFLPAHREIFDAMMEISRRQQPIDVVSLGDELKSRGSLARLEGGVAYLIAIANAVPTAENIGHYVRLVKEKAIVRRMIAACAEIQSCGYGDFGEFGQFLDQSETLFFKVAQQGRRDSYRRVGDMMPGLVESLETRSTKRRQVTGVYLILFVHREEMFDDNPELKGRAELIIGEDRHGPTADVPLTFLSQYTRPENWAEETCSNIGLTVTGLLPSGLGTMAAALYDPGGSPKKQLYVSLKRGGVQIAPVSPPCAEIQPSRYWIPTQAQIRASSASS